MAAPPYGLPPSFSKAEKNFLLAEIIKQAGPEPIQLLNLLNNIAYIPSIRWQDLPLPFGRSLNDCMTAFQDLQHSAGISGGISLQTGAFSPQTSSPLSGSVSLGKRQFPFESYTGREIRPKPSTGSAYGQPPPIEQPPRKKRGRPKKTEVAARADPYGSSSEPGPGRRAASVGSSFPGPSSAVGSEPGGTMTAGTSPTEPTRPLQPPISGMSISSILTPAPQQAASQSGSSSGNRRRGRSTRSEPEDLPRAGTSGAATQSFGQRQEYESPYARMATESQETPARTAVLRQHPLEPSSPLQPPHTSQLQPQPPLPPTTAGEPPHSL